MRIQNTFFQSILMLCLFTCSLPVMASLQCHDIFQFQNAESIERIAQDLSHQTAREVENIFESQGSLSNSKKGYAILVGTMVGSAILTTYLSSKLPPEMQFTSLFVAQLSTLGVYVLGAPIWEPLSSRFRQWAFGITKEKIANRSASQPLENTWARTQENYSLNAQMSRNVMNQFILTVKDNFYHAYRAYSESNQDYSADQVAEAAYRMRVLFRDISPTDPSVTQVIKSTFTNHVQIDQNFINKVWQKLAKMDSDFSTPEAQSYYNLVLNTWLTL